MEAETVIKEEEVEEEVVEELVIHEQMLDDTLPPSEFLASLVQVELMIKEDLKEA